MNPEWDKALSYHPLKGDRAELHEALREAAKEYAEILDKLTPPSREKAVAFTNLQDSLMWGNAALAIHYEE